MKRQQTAPSQPQSSSSTKQPSPRSRRPSYEKGIFRAGGSSSATMRLNNEHASNMATIPVIEKQEPTSRELEFLQLPTKGSHNRGGSDYDFEGNTFTTIPASTRGTSPNPTLSTSSSPSFLQRERECRPFRAKPVMLDGTSSPTFDLTSRQNFRGPSEKPLDRSSNPSPPPPYSSEVIRRDPQDSQRRDSGQEPARQRSQSLDSKGGVLVSSSAPSQRPAAVQRPSQTSSLPYSANAAVAKRPVSPQQSVFRAITPTTGISGGSNVGNRSTPPNSTSTSLSTSTNVSISSTDRRYVASNTLAVRGGSSIFHQPQPLSQDLVGNPLELTGQPGSGGQIGINAYPGQSKVNSLSSTTALSSSATTNSNDLINILSAIDPNSLSDEQMESIRRVVSTMEEKRRQSIAPTLNRHRPKEDSLEGIPPLTDEGSRNISQDADKMFESQVPGEETKGTVDKKPPSPYLSFIGSLSMNGNIKPSSTALLPPSASFSELVPDPSKIGTFCHVGRASAFSSPTSYSLNNNNDSNPAFD